MKERLCKNTFCVITMHPPCSPRESAGLSGAGRLPRAPVAGTPKFQYPKFRHTKFRHPKSDTRSQIPEIRYLKSDTRNQTPGFLPSAPDHKGESLLNLWRRTVHLRRPERARIEGCTGLKRLNDTRCKMPSICLQGPHGELRWFRAPQILGCYVTKFAPHEAL